MCREETGSHRDPAGRSRGSHTLRRARRSLSEQGSIRRWEAGHLHPSLSATATHLHAKMRLTGPSEPSVPGLFLALLYPLYPAKGESCVGTVVGRIMRAGCASILVNHSCQLHVTTLRCLPCICHELGRNCVDFQPSTGAPQILISYLFRTQYFPGRMRYRPGNVERRKPG